MAAESNRCRREDVSPLAHSTHLVIIFFFRGEGESFLPLYLGCNVAPLSES